MKCSLIVFWALASIASAQLGYNDSKIVGGVAVTDNRVPYIVSLRTSAGRFFCAGSIITNRWILTSAHCIYEYYPSYIVAGTNRLSSGGFRYDIITIIPHWDYRSTTVQNDIAMLKTAIAIVWTSWVQPINLPSFNIGSSVPVLIAGWGQQSNPGIISDNLMMLATRTVSYDDCTRMWGSIKIFSTHLCTLTTGSRASCIGDSGGPVAVNGAIHGVNSFVKPCALGTPDVNTRVFWYNAWISNNILRY